MDSEFPEQTQARGEPRPVLDEVAELQEGLSRMESLIQQAAALAVQQARRADEIQAGFEAAAAALESQLQKKQTEANQADSGAGGGDPTLTNRIQELESQLREKGELLEARSAELNDLRAKLEQAAASAAEAKPAQEIEQNFEATVAALKSQLTEKEALLSQKDIAMKEMEESLTALEESLVNQIRILEGQLEEMAQGSAPEQPGAEEKKSSRKSPKQG